MHEETNKEDELKSSVFTEVIALLFVTIILVFLFIKILFF